jgi:hypothetical protein
MVTAARVRTGAIAISSKDDRIYIPRKISLSLSPYGINHPPPPFSLHALFSLKRCYAAFVASDIAADSVASKKPFFRT